MKTLEKTNYDYIIVGAGSAGCVIARRLIENTDATVLVLEAGGPGTGIDTITNPARWPENVGSPSDYFYQYEPSPQANDRIIVAPRGKVLGGSGSINAMVWARGNSADYDGWANAGNKGWDYKSVLPLFKKIENHEGRETDFHGAGGPVNIEIAKNLHIVASAMIKAGQTFGMPLLHDTNGPDPEGVGPMSMNIHNGVRCSPFNAYLEPVLDQKNLTVFTGAKVLKLNIESSRCTGLDFLQGGKTRTVNASKEVILCAGAFESPRILMLSGIGPKDELSRIGIETITDLPGVGQNLQDHPIILGMSFEASVPMRGYRHNLMGSNIYWKSKPDLHQPDLMILPLQIQMVTTEIADYMPVSDNAFTIAPALIDVESRGYVKLKTKAHDGLLEIQPNFMSERSDLEALIRSVEISLELTSQPAFKDIIKRSLLPKTLDSRESIIAFLKYACSSYFHPVGTCAMGTGTEAVVNDHLQVYGIEGLRIADASVMPKITTSNTLAPTLMIGEFAAQLILAKK